MSYCYITFRSITGAQRGDKILEQANINHQMMRTPQAMAKNGCGYALRVRGQDFEQVMEVLQEAHAPYQKAYADFGLGVMEELEP